MLCFLFVYLYYFMIVYFVKHRNQSPIKIGYTDDLSRRIYSFNNASPWGIDIIGTIETDNAPKLEKILHEKLKSFRLNGEWFEITEEYALSLISIYANKDYIDSKNSFETKYANRNNVHKEEYIEYNFSFERSEVYCKEVYVNQTELSEITGISKEDIRKIFKANNIKGKSKKILGVVKSVYKIYLKNNFDL